VIGLKAVVYHGFDFRFKEFGGKGYISIAILERKRKVYLNFAFFNQCSESVKLLSEEIVSQKLQ
jgi:hypothetical protein